MVDNHAAFRSRWRLPAALAAALAAVVVVAPPAGAATVEATIAGLAFVPATAPLQMDAGEAALPEPHGHVRWTNADPGSEHTVTFDDPRLVSSPRLATGQVHEVLFLMVGTFAYRCTIHPAMTGTVVVSPAPPPRSAAADGTSRGARAEGGSGSGVVPLVIGSGGLAAAAVVLWLLFRRRRGTDEPAA